MDGMDAETEYVTPGGDVGGSTSTVDPREAWDDMSIDEQFEAWNEGAGNAAALRRQLERSGEARRQTRTDLLLARSELDTAEAEVASAAVEIARMREQVAKKAEKDHSEELEVARAEMKSEQELRRNAQKECVAQKTELEECLVQLNELEIMLKNSGQETPKRDSSAGLDAVRQRLFLDGKTGRLIPGSTIAAKVRTHAEKHNKYAEKVKSELARELTEDEVSASTARMRKDLVRAQVLGHDENDLSELRVPTQTELVPGEWLKKLFGVLKDHHWECLAAELAGDLSEYAQVVGHVDDMEVYSRREYALIDLQVGELLWKAVMSSQHVGLQIGFAEFSENGEQSRKFSLLFRIVLTEVRMTAVGAECEQIRRYISFRAQGRGDVEVTVELLKMLPEMRSAAVSLEDMFVMNGVCQLSNEVVRLIPGLMKLLGTGEVGYDWLEKSLKELLAQLRMGDIKAQLGGIRGDDNSGDGNPGDDNADGAKGTGNCNGSGGEELHRNADMKTCNQCGSDGHTRKKCPEGNGRNSRGCWDCGKQGHRHGDSECKMRKESDEEGDDDDPEADLECWRCSGSHSPDKCWAREKECHKCGKKGHIRAQCDAAQKREKSNETNMVTLEKREGQLQQELDRVHRGILKIEKKEKKISLALEKKKQLVAESDTGSSDYSEDSGWGSDHDSE